MADDALYHTYQTMRAFGSLGRKGFDNSNTEARIVIESSAGDAAYTGNVGYDQAMFIQNPKDAFTARARDRVERAEEARAPARRERAADDRPRCECARDRCRGTRE